MGNTGTPYWTGFGPRLHIESEDTEVLLDIAFQALPPSPHG